MMKNLTILFLILSSSSTARILCLNTDLQYDWNYSVKLQTGERVDWEDGDIGLQPMGLLKGNSYCDGSMLRSPNEFYVSKMPFDSLEFCEGISLQDTAYFETSRGLATDYWYRSVAPGGYFGFLKQKKINLR